MTIYECLRLELVDIPDEIIKECNLHSIEHDCWVHAEIRKVTYGLPQVRTLATKSSNLDCVQKDAISPLRH